MITIYHNPRCRKSREALKVLEESGRAFKIVEYLKETLSESELRDILQRLGMKAEEIVRKEENLYKENYKGKDISNSEWITILAHNPSLIQRPIIVNNEKAVLGRPVENVKHIF